MNVRELVEKLSQLSAEERDLPVLITEREGEYVEVKGVTIGSAARLGEPDERFVYLYNSFD